MPLYVPSRFSRQQDSHDKWRLPMIIKAAVLFHAGFAMAYFVAIDTVLAFM